MRGYRFTIVALCLVPLLGALAGAARAVPPVSFAPHIDYAVGVQPYGVTCGDLNGDGLADAITGNFGDGTVSVLLSDGHGGFTAAPTLATGMGCYAAGLGDVNGDGKLDLAVPCIQSGATWVWLGDGTGRFGPPTQYASPPPAGAQFADLNHDGHPDLVVSASNCSGTHLIMVRLGDGTGAFGALTTFDVCSCPTQFSISDVDGDGNLDVVAAGFFGGITVLFGNGAGGFPTRWDGSAGEAIYGGIAADLDGDGRPDLVASSAYYGRLHVWPGLGGRSFGSRHVYSTAGGATLALADVNLDGKIDAITTNSNRVGVTLGNGDGTFGASMAFPSGGNSANGDAVADVNGDGRPDILLANFDTNTLSVLLNTTGTTVTPQAPATCITPSHTCVDVPVAIARTSAENVRGYSVTLQLAGNLAPCGTSVSEGTYLSSIAGTDFHLVANGGGSYTVDCAILGGTCGAIAPSGTLFTLHLGSGAATGTGTVTVIGVTLRDCDNGPIAAYAGTPASVTIDNTPPTALTLTAAQRRSGNDASGTTLVDMAWSGTVVAGDAVHVYRAGWGDYPEYEAGGVPAVPSWPPAAPWTLAGTVSGVTTFADHPATRDFWYYVAFVEDPCGNVGPVSNRTGGTLGYHLGDVSDGTTQCAGNNLVAGEDISFLGGHYGATLADPSALGCLDVGPTTDGRVTSRPVTDDRLNFEDLMILAINYGVVSAPQLAASPLAATDARVTLDAPSHVTAGETFAVALRMSSAGVQGVSAQLGWDASIAEPVSMVAGAALQAQNGVAFSAQPGNVDAVVLGTGRTFAGQGELATVTFRALAAGEPAIVLAKLEARDATNAPVVLGGTSTAPPSRTALAAVLPNPFHGATTLSWTLAAAGRAELAIYGVDGRRIAVLASGTYAAGAYTQVWDGRDGDGRAVRPGVYFARLVTAQGRCTTTLVLMR